ncbi:hypothetical protein RND71_009589 [Anisodus tanguticus]|uniref:Chitin-binding type-1 domain-containing protein n=1 Tax=Anisodus tanguticus TaxID=243964 RepID=A0AAE1SIB9_9SOLA|nr:hypothetical protein RND71_009589 [Anisodus tanguticus]
MILALLLTTASAQQCGRQARGRSCANGLCCSQDGFCGTTRAYCGVGCRGIATVMPPIPLAMMNTRMMVVPINERVQKSLPIGWTVGAMIYFTGEVSSSSPGWPSSVSGEEKGIYSGSAYQPLYRYQGKGRRHLSMRRK